MAFFDFFRRKRPVLPPVVVNDSSTSGTKRKRGRPATKYKQQLLPLFAGVATGRKSTEPNLETLSAPFTYIPRQFSEYHKYELTKLALLNSTDIIRLLVYVEPNVSHAISNFLRVFDSGFFLTARKSNGSVHQEGQKYLDGLLERLAYPISNGFIPDRSLTGLYLKFATHVLLDGAISGELEFDENYRAVGIHSVDPATITFKAKDSRMYPVQFSGQGETELDIRNFFYIPVDPIAGDPYGTNQVLSVIQAVMNKFKLLQDFARALRNLGFDRIDISLDQEAIIEACRSQGISDPEGIKAAINKALDDARKTMQSLEADDNPVHLDVVKLTALEGRNSTTGMNVQAIVDVLLSDIASGLKTYATILGKRFGGSTEGYTSVEGLLFVKLIEGFQVIVKRILDRIFTLALQVEGGIQAYADWQWLEPHLRPTYESAQYYAAYSFLLFEEEQLGAISEDERNFLVRKMLGQKGSPPPDAKRNPDFEPSGKNLPQRDVSQEDEKEKKRKDTNRDRKGTGEEDTTGDEE